MIADKQKQHSGRSAAVKTRRKNPNRDTIRRTSNDWKREVGQEAPAQGLEHERGDWQPEDWHTRNLEDHRFKPTKDSQSGRKKTVLRKFDATKGYPGEGPTKRDRRNDPKAPREMVYCKCEAESKCLIHGHFHKVKGKAATQASRRLKEKNRKAVRVKICNLDPTQHGDCSDHCHSKWQVISSPESRKNIADAHKRDEEKHTQTKKEKFKKKEMDFEKLDKEVAAVYAAGLDPGHDYDDTLEELTSHSDDPDSESGDEASSSSSEDTDSGSDAASDQDEPQPSNESVIETPKEIETEKRVIYCNGYQGDTTRGRKFIKKISPYIPGLRVKTRFKLNAIDKKLLPETQALELFENEAVTMCGISVFKMKRGGDVILLEKVYDSARVGTVYTDLARNLLCERILVTRTAVCADGSPTNGFFAQMKEVATKHVDYKQMMNNQEYFADTLDHVYNQFILRGIRQMMSQSKPVGMNFRRYGPRGAIRPRDRHSG